jgi:hypothetical protein
MSVLVLKGWSRFGVLKCAITSINFVMSVVYGTVLILTPVIEFFTS